MAFKPLFHGEAFRVGQCFEPKILPLRKAKLSSIWKRHVLRPAPPPEGGGFASA